MPWQWPGPHNCYVITISQPICDNNSLACSFPNVRTFILIDLALVDQVLHFTKLVKVKVRGMFEPYSDLHTPR